MHAKSTPAERREGMKNMSNEELINNLCERYTEYRIAATIGFSDIRSTTRTQFDYGKAELLRRLEEGEKAKEAIEILCYISLGGGIISRGKACEFMGIGRAELDEKLGEIQLGIAKRNIDLVDFYQNSKA